MPPKITFVVLHYLAIKETIDCVMSIEHNICYGNFYVVIVDNGSNKEQDINSLRALESTFSNLKLIVSEENVGFASGNNIGFQYAKKVLHSDFIVCLNNDTIVSQSDFCNIIVAKYQMHQYAVLGPKIITKDGRCDSNPIKPSNYTTKALFRYLFVLCVLYLTTFINIDLSVQAFLEKIRKKVNESNKFIEYTTDVVDLKLHGACLIFSPRYINQFEGLNPNTFLYMEEDILYVQLKKNGLVSLYSPDLEIYHLEDAATNLTVNKKIAKRRFIYKNHIKSIRVLLKEIENYEC